MEMEMEMEMEKLIVFVVFDTSFFVVVHFYWLCQRKQIVLSSLKEIGKVE